MLLLLHHSNKKVLLTYTYLAIAILCNFIFNALFEILVDVKIGKTELGRTALDMLFFVFQLIYALSSIGLGIFAIIKKKDYTIEIPKNLDISI